MPLFNSPFYVETSPASVCTTDACTTRKPTAFMRSAVRRWSTTSYGAGANIGQNLTVTVDWQHMSGYVFGCVPNEGLNGLAAEVGWKF